MAKIKAMLNFGRLLLPDLVSRGHAVFNGFNGNTNYTTPPPPVDPNVLKTSLDDLSAKMAAALDGGKKALEAQKQAKKPVVNMLEALAHYAEVNCKEDMNIFLSSGFAARSTTRTPPGPVATPTIEKVTQGKTTEARASIKPVKGARSYVIQYGPLGPGGTPPTTWASTPAVKSRPASLITGLTPGTTYAFQVRALGPEGYTDWSPSVTRMVI